jgi:uncharacterized protein
MPELPTTPPADPTGPPSDRVRLRRKPQRGHHDRVTIDAILDAGLVAHVGYVEDGQPYVIPTLYWRDGDRVYWHGSAASRMIRAVGAGAPVCLTVTIIDSLVLARSGTNHSADYRSVMVIGTASPVEGEAKARALDAIVDRLTPGRAATLRPSTAKEIAATGVVSMAIDEASAKVRDIGVSEDPGDERWPVWAGTVPIHLTFGAPVPASDLLADIPMPENVRGLADR